VARREEGKGIPLGFQGLVIFQDDRVRFFEIFGQQQVGIPGNDRTLVAGGVVGMSVGNKARFFPPSGVQPQVEVRQINSPIKVYLHDFPPSSKLVPAGMERARWRELAPIAPAQT
jgi:hypothetical protein